MAEVKAHNIDEKFRTDDIQIDENVDFKGLFLSSCVLDGLNKAGFKRPSPIQLKAIPLGRCGLDLIVQAKSGTGKTCVFTVIALENLILETKNVQVLILAPTREIAVQVAQVILAIGSCMPKMRCFAFIGGTPFTKDKFKLKCCHIAVGTPGRVRQLIEGGYLQTESIRLFVLDEADKLIADGFQDSINWIYSYLPENKQMIALSATYPESLAQLLTRYMRDPTFVRLNPSDPSLLGVKQFFKSVTYHSTPQKIYDLKVNALLDILNRLPFNQCLIFSNYQNKAQILANILTSHGWPTAFLAGCQAQIQRLQAIATLQQFQCRILVSTDLTARGIDAEHVNVIINMEVPVDSDTYLHRIGRAGRFGTIGIAVTLVSEGKELEVLETMISKSKLNIQMLPENLDESIWKPNANMSTENKLQTVDEVMVVNKEDNLDNIENETQLPGSSLDTRIDQKITNVILTGNPSPDLLDNLTNEDKHTASGNFCSEEIKTEEMQNGMNLPEKNYEEEINREKAIDEILDNYVKDNENIKNHLSHIQDKVNEENDQQSIHDESDKQESISSCCSDDDSFNKIEIYSNHADLSSDAVSISNYLISKNKKVVLINGVEKTKAKLNHNASCPILALKKKVHRGKSCAELYASSSSLEDLKESAESPKKHKCLKKNSHSKVCEDVPSTKTSPIDHDEIETKEPVNERENNNPLECVSNDNVSDEENSSTYQSSSTDVLKGNETVEIVSEDSSKISSITFSPLMKEGDLDDDVCLSEHTDTKSSDPPNKTEIFNSLITVLPASYAKDIFTIPGSSYAELVEDLAAFIEKHASSIDLTVNENDVKNDAADEIKKEEGIVTDDEQSPIPVPRCIHSYIKWVLANKEKYLLPEEVLASFNEYLFKRDMEFCSPEETATKLETETDNICNKESMTSPLQKNDEKLNLILQAEQLQEGSPQIPSGSVETQLKRLSSNDLNKELIELDTVEHFHLTVCESSSDVNLSELAKADFKIPDLAELDRQLNTQQETLDLIPVNINPELSEKLQTNSESASTSSTKILNEDKIDPDISKQNEETESTDESSTCSEDTDSEENSDDDSSSTDIAEETAAPERSKQVPNLQNSFSYSSWSSHKNIKSKASKKSSCDSYQQPTSSKHKKEECHCESLKNSCLKNHTVPCVFCQSAFWTMYFRNCPKPCNSCQCCNYWNYWNYTWNMYRVNNGMQCHTCHKCKKCNS